MTPILGASTVDLALGLVFGILASLVAWWVIARLFVPRLSISKINLIDDPAYPAGARYRIKVMNRSRRRLAADVEIRARIRVRGLNSALPDNWYSVEVPIGDGQVFPVLLPRKGTTYTLHVGEIRGHSLRRFPSEVRDQLPAVNLEQMLALGTDATLRVLISASHEVSGNRRTYLRDFTSTDIEPGRFEKSGIRIVSPNSNSAALDPSEPGEDSPPPVANPEEGLANG